jgi:hypothetical protein
VTHCSNNALLVLVRTDGQKTPPVVFNCCRCRMQVYTDLRAFYEDNRAAVYTGPGELCSAT